VEKTMTNGFEKLLSFINKLKEMEIPFSIECNREDAIMVLVVVPSEKWEVDVFEDGTVEIEIFRSDSEIYSDSEDSKLKELFVLFTDPENSFSHDS
jgi:hypothetical protein